MSDVYEKVAALPAFGAAALAAARVAAPAVAHAARGALSFTGHALRSAAGFGSTKALTGAAAAGRTAGNAVAGANAVGGALQTGMAVKDMVAPPPAPATNSSSRQATADSPGAKLGSLERRVTKVAFGLSNATNIAGYLSLIGAEALPHDHPWHGRLEFGGLGLLAAPTLVDAVQNPEGRGEAIQDLAGLALFANAAHGRLSRHGAGGHVPALPHALTAPNTAVPLTETLDETPTAPPRG